MRTPRPSLNALRAFEAVARLRSMTLAAEELFVTHGAVSRQIKALEETLGVRLLKRGSQSTDPTPEGWRLAEGLSAAFNLMQATIEQLQPGPLTLSCSASVMMYWLLPRIARFHERHPQIELQFNMNYDQIDFMRDKISVAIRNSTIAPPRGAVVRDLATEWIGPVCSPEYLGALPLRRPQDLLGARLLVTKTRPHAWTDWLAAAGNEPMSLATHERFEHFYLLIQAAVCGLGVAAVPQMLVGDDLRAGKLVAPFGFVPGPRQLQIWIAPHLGSRADVHALERWLAEEMRASVEALEVFRAGSAP